MLLFGHYSNEWLANDKYKTSEDREVFRKELVGEAKFGYRTELETGKVFVLHVSNRQSNEVKARLDALKVRSGFGKALGWVDTDPRAMLTSDSSRVKLAYETMRKQCAGLTDEAINKLLLESGRLANALWSDLSEACMAAALEVAQCDATNGCWESLRQTAAGILYLVDNGLEVDPRRANEETCITNYDADLESYVLRVAFKPAMMLLKEARGMSNHGYQRYGTAVNAVDEACSILLGNYINKDVESEELGMFRSHGMKPWLADSMTLAINAIESGRGHAICFDERRDLANSARQVRATVFTGWLLKEVTDEIGRKAVIDAVNKAMASKTDNEKEADRWRQVHEDGYDTEFEEEEDSVDEDDD